MKTEMSRPFVSILTPTYNRAKFIPALVECYKSQTYPKERMEWILLDDGTEKVGETIAKLTKGLPNIRYIAMDEKVNIGAKRNLLNKEAKGEIIVCMDDDDFYSPERVSHAVTRLMSMPKVELAGSSELYMYYTDNGEIIKLGPYGKSHATNGTMAYRASYKETHIYDESVTYAEERSFLDNYKNPMIQLDPMKVMLVISHSQNTFNKQPLREKESQFVKKTSMKIRDFIKDKSLRDFYATA
jgi:glycosyltransferase involved in cell wall biosynthesis